MVIENSNFLKALSKKSVNQIPLYCTGYPDIEFMEKYVKLYDIKCDHNEDFVLLNKDYSYIKEMGFDAISLWDFRRGKGGYKLNNQLRVDSWGRIYRDDWYLWDGVIKDQTKLEEWEHLTLPSNENLVKLRNFIRAIKNELDPVLSLPGLFEKTWQSMGFLHFSKCLKNNLPFIEKVISFFSEYTQNLIKVLQKTGAYIFLIADDCGYKGRTFIPEELWEKFFFKPYKKIIDLVHKNDHKIIIHSDGYITDMIQKFIDLGFDAVQSLEPNAGVDIISLFRKFTNQICFIGNLDISTILPFENPKIIKNYVQNLIKKALESNNSLIISPTQKLHSKINPKNVKIMIETTKNFK